MLKATLKKFHSDKEKQF